MALAEYAALVDQIDFDYLYTGTPHAYIDQNKVILRSDILYRVN
jgi:hypothetical protein